MNDEQIQERAYTIAYGSMDRKEMHCDIAAALREAREEALEEAAKVAESRIPTLQANGGEPAIRGHAIRINSIDIAAAIRKLKGSDHEG